MRNGFKWLEGFLAGLGRATAWTVPILVLSVCITVGMVQLRWNVLWEWDAVLPLFGNDLSLAGLTELQWHLFALFTMLGGVYALHDGRHVSVDFLSSRFSPRVRAGIRVFGDLFLLLPFACIMTYYAWQYVLTAYGTDEASSYGGLADRWIVKAVIPLGFGALALYALSRGLRTILALCRGNVGDDDASQAGDQ